MRFTSLAFLSCLSTFASAHFKLQYPEPRGVFVADNEVNFCGMHSLLSVYLVNVFTQAT